MYIYIYIRGKEFVSIPLTRIHKEKLDNGVDAMTVFKGAISSNKRVKASFTVLN